MNYVQHDGPNQYGPRNADDLAYLAGFFDGEGCVMLSRSSGPRQAHWQLRIKVAQVDPRPLWLLRDRFGGTIARYPAHGRNKTLFHWTLTSRKAEAFLRTLAACPHLVVKRAQVEFALYAAMATRGSGGTQVDGWLKAERDACADALMDAKRLSWEPAA